MGQAFIYGQRGGGSSSLFKFLDYTGTYSMYGDTKKGYIFFYSSGTLTFERSALIDIFCDGGGGAGSPGDDNRGGGGGGGYTSNLFQVAVTGDTPYPITIGSGGAVRGRGGTTTFGTLLSAEGGFGTSNWSGGNGGSGGGSGGSGSGGHSAGAGGTDGSGGGYAGSTGSGNPGPPGTGQGTTTRPFLGDKAPFSTMQFAGGGGGSSWMEGPGGEGGGGRGGGGSSVYAEAHAASPGVPNTGGGGGGSSPYNPGAPGAGGSGICIIRWGDWSTGMEA